MGLARAYERRLMLDSAGRPRPAVAAQAPPIFPANRLPSARRLDPAPCNPNRPRQHHQQNLQASTHQEQHQQPLLQKRRQWGAAVTPTINKNLVKIDPKPPLVPSSPPVLMPSSIPSPVKTAVQAAALMSSGPVIMTTSLSISPPCTPPTGATAAPAPPAKAQPQTAGPATLKNTASSPPAVTPTIPAATMVPLVSTASPPTLSSPVASLETAVVLDMATPIVASTSSSLPPPSHVQDQARSAWQGSGSTIPHQLLLVHTASNKPTKPPGDADLHQ
ncbi:hypothetical protein BS78_09G117800 [Paspalum vaginatum]|nr:hypothetical protein BS78_09G117800 [Paspalum vaginatum]